MASLNGSGFYNLFIIHITSANTVHYILFVNV